MRKVQLYIVSLWLLFLLVAVKEFRFVSGNFLSANIIPIVALVLLLFGIYFYVRFTYLLKGSTLLKKKIKKIEDQNYEHLTFLTTYIIPFLRVRLEGRDLLITILLLVIIGFIFVKTNLFYKNPTLALLGYKLYKVDTETDIGLIFISKQPLTKELWVDPIPLGDNIYFVTNGKRTIN